MLVCICKKINDKQVADAIASGATKWHDVHTHFGERPNCGKCKCEIRDALASHHARAQSGAPSMDERIAAKSV